MFDVLLYVAVAVVGALVGYRVGTTLASHRKADLAFHASAGTARLARQLNDLETERARMAAILSGMVEGVLVVDGEGRLRLVNDAARRMLNLESNLLGRHYVEAVR